MSDFMTCGPPHVAHHRTNWMTRRCGPYRIAGLIASSPQYPSQLSPPLFFSRQSPILQYLQRSSTCSPALSPSSSDHLGPSNRRAPHNATMAVIDEQAAAPQPIDIEAWTEQATAALGSVTISVPGEVVGATAVTTRSPLAAQSNPWVLLQLQRKVVSIRGRRL
jgi:hypothetical protein